METFDGFMDSVQQVNVGGRTSVHVRINVSTLLGSMFYFSDLHLDVYSGQDIMSGSVNFKRGTKRPTAIQLQSKNS
jgi:hypothetical protein